MNYYSQMHCAAANKTAEENTDTPRLFRFLASINNTVISDQISRSGHLPRILQESFKRTLVLEAGYQLSEGIDLACITNVMSIQSERIDLNEIRPGYTRARSNAC